MTIKCFVCSRKYLKLSSVTFHRFPKDPQTREMWMKNLGICEDEANKVNECSRICSKHFQDSDFAKSPGGKMFLIKGVLPLPSDAVPQLETMSHSKPSTSTTAKDCKIQVIEDILLPSWKIGESAVSQHSFTSTSTESADIVNLAEVYCSRESPFSKRARIQDISDAEKTSGTETAPETLREIQNMPTSTTKQKLNKRKSKQSTVRYFGDITLKDLENPKTLRKCWNIINSKVASLQHKIKNLQQSKRRMMSRISCQNSLLHYLKNHNYLSENASQTVQASLPSPARDIVKRMKEGKCKKYDEELKAFSLTLNFYSPKAYAFVREKFNKSLPHPSTLSKWYQSVDGAPGFTQEAIRAVSMKVREAENHGHKVICNLVFDEISIRKRIEWTGVKATGYVDIGTNLNSDILPVATEALVFMLVAINAHWKVPIGYFLIDGLTAAEKANLVLKCLKFIHQPGLIVSSLTFDETSTNLSMCQQLGANFEILNMQSYFIHPITNKNIYIFLDPSHMIKLVRNCFGDYKIISTLEGNFIKWSYLEKLAEIQQSEGLEAATKLKKRHIDWHNEKMKVKLATQIFSKSVSDALLFLCNDLKLPDFQGTEETAKFIKTFNDLFDIFNSRTRLASYVFQRPLSPATKNTFFNLMDDATNYIKSLYINATPLLQSRRKTGFLGFLICIESLKNYYCEYVENDPLLKYIISYKFSQDHLEIFFSVIRSKGGFNNNPTARQFEATYKKLLVHAEIRGSKYGNASLLDSTSILQCTSKCTVTGTSNEVVSTLDVDEIHIDHDYISPTSCNLSEYLVDIIAYISGFVIKSIKSHITCYECLDMLEGNISISKLQKRKQYGNLFIASSYVHTVCQLAEKTLRFYKKILSNIITVKNINNILLIKCLDIIPPSVFDVFKNHKIDGNVYNSHFLVLTKMIVNTYFKIRLHRECRSLHENVNRIRSKCTKYVLFSHQ